MPQLRARVAVHPSRREQILVLSAKHGLIPAQTPLLPYDQSLTPHRVAELGSQIDRAWVQQTRHAVVDELLLLLEPAYLRLIAPSVLRPPPTLVYWIPDPTQAWEHASAVLDRWGWWPVPGTEAGNGRPR